MQTSVDGPLAPRWARDRRQFQEQAEGAAGLDRRGHAARSRPRAHADRSAHEIAEERMRPRRARLELGVELRGAEPRVVVELDDLDQVLGGEHARDAQAGGLEPRAQVVVDLVAVAVALVDERLAVGLVCARAAAQLDRLGAQAHRAAHVLDVLLLGQQRDHGIERVGIELRRVGAVHAADVARELDDRALHAEADAEERRPRLAGVAHSRDLALDRPRAEAAGDEDAVDAAQLLGGLVGVERLGVDPVDLEVRAVVDGAVLERLDDGEVGVLQLHVLADDGDAHAALEIVDAPAERLPLVELARRDLEAEALEHELVEALLAQAQGHGVEVRDVLGGDHGALVEVGEERDLGTQLARAAGSRSGDDDVGRDTDAAQLVDGVLGGLRLELARGLDHRHEGDVQVEHVVAAELGSQLPDRLEERQALDVADRAADLDEHDVDVARGRDAAGCGS